MIISDHKYSEEISANGEEEGEIFFREQIKGKMRENHLVGR